MRDYLCHFIKKDAASAGWRTLPCDGDGPAQDLALGWFAGYPHADKVEVWDGTRLTFSYSRLEVPTPAELRRLCYLAIAAAKREPDPKTRRAIAAGAALLAQEAEALERRAKGGIAQPV